MHGLIFKTKESHRQDQSESFVIYMGSEREREACTRNMCMLLLLLSPPPLFTTSQMKSLHYDQCFCRHIYIWSRKTHIYSLFHRDETKPTHIIGINSFLFFMQLIYKHSSPNYQHMINSCKLINKMLVSLRLCAYVETFSTAFTSLPFVMSFLLFVQFVRVSCDISIYDERETVDEAASTTFFSHHIPCISHC